MLDNEFIFNEEEKQYYDFCLRNRQALTNSVLPKLDRTYKKQIENIDQFGYEIIKPKKLAGFEQICLDVNDIFSSKNQRSINNPLLEINGLYNFIKENAVGFACEYFNCVPMLSFIKIIKSDIINKKPKDTQFFHRDPGSFKFLKLVIYLHDVDENSGPFSYVENSHKDFYFGKNGRKRYSDEDVINSHGEQKIKNLIGKKGDMIFFNPVGLHKGKLPLKSNRTAIIANFTLHPEYGQKDNFARIKFDMKNMKTSLDYFLLQACEPRF